MQDFVNKWHTLSCIKLYACIQKNFPLEGLFHPVPSIGKQKDECSADQLSSVPNYELTHSKTNMCHRPVYTHLNMCHRPVHTHLSGSGWRIQEQNLLPEKFVKQNVLRHAKIVLGLQSLLRFATCSSLQTLETRCFTRCNEAMLSAE